MSERNYDALNAKTPAATGGTTYLKLAHGCLMQDKREWGKELRGFYLGHTLRWDAGNRDARVDPNHRLQVWLDTRDGKVCIEASTNSRTAFGMLACFLFPFSPDDAMFVSAFEGTSDGTANAPTCVCLYRLDEAGEEFKIVPKDERFRAKGEFWSEREPEYLKMLREHAGYQEPKNGEAAAPSEFDLMDELLKSKGWPVLEEAPSEYRSVFARILSSDIEGFERLRGDQWNTIRLTLGRTKGVPTEIRGWLEANPAPAAAAPAEYDPFADE